MNKILKNTDAIRHLLKKKNAKRVFLVTGKESYEKSGVKRPMDEVLEDYDCWHYNNFKTNPCYEDLLEGARLYKSFSPDFIIAAGGGSVIDTAKILAVLSDNIENARAVIEGQIPANKRKAVFVAIPTTAGSGSEATHFAVAYIGMKKYSVAHRELLPDYVLLEPAFTSQMPPYLTAVTGIDAFSQALESLWAKSATAESKLYAGEALREIFSVFPAVVHKPCLKSREIMQRAAYLAGKAINIAKTTAPHALSYAIAQMYQVPHGQAVAVSLPAFFEFNLKNSADARMVEDICKILNCETIDEGQRKIQKLIVDSGLKLKISELGAKSKEDIDTIVRSVNTERLSNNPVVPTEEELYHIVFHIYCDA